MPEGPLTTGVDALIDAVNERRALSFDEAASMVKVPVRTIEAWASFLEEEGLLRVEYRLTKPYLVATSATKAAPARGEVRVMVRQVERPQRIQRERPVLALGEQEAPSAEVDALLADARDALAAGDSQRAKDIYTQLQERYKQFPKRVRSEREAMITTLSQLNAALLEESGTDKDSEAAAKSVREELVQVQQLCKKGQRDAALEAFMKAHNAFENVKATELRLSLTPLMSHAQQALLETERIAASKDWSAQLARVQALLDKLDKAIAAQDTAAAFILYEQIEEAKKAIPSMVSERKTDMERRVLPIYERLLSLHLSLAKRELEQKIDMLAAIESKIDEAIAAGNPAEASRLYERARRAYLSIPDEFFERKIEEQKTLLSYSSRIADLELRTTAVDVRTRLNQIDAQVQQAIIAIGKGDVLKAQDIYNTIIGSFSGLPSGFGDDKLTVQKRIVALYEQLLRASKGKIAPPLAIPDNLIEEGMHLFGQAITERAWSRAINIADRIGQLHVPRGREEAMAQLLQKAALLRDATIIDDINDAKMLGESLRQLHASYALLKGIAEPVLLAQVKDCYVRGLKKMSSLAARTPAQVNVRSPRAALAFETPVEERVTRVALPQEVAEPLSLSSPVVRVTSEAHDAMTGKKNAKAVKGKTGAKMTGKKGDATTSESFATETTPRLVPRLSLPSKVVMPAPKQVPMPASRPLSIPKIVVPSMVRQAAALPSRPAPVLKPAPMLRPAPAARQVIPAVSHRPDVPPVPVKRSPADLLHEISIQHELPQDDDFVPRHDLIIASAIEHENTHYRLPPGHIDARLPAGGLTGLRGIDDTDGIEGLEGIHLPPAPVRNAPEHDLYPPVPKPPVPLLASKVPVASMPTSKTQERAPARKMTADQIEDAWREGMTLWREALDKQQWLEAQNIAELLLRLGDPPQTLEPKALGVVRQAELLRRGHSLASIKDLEQLRVELSGFYVQYSETLRAYPHEPALYAHLKAVYTGSMGALNAAAMNVAAKTAIRGA